MDSLFVHDREVPPAWQRDLERLAPPSDQVTWLKLVWEPGDPWEPVQRWEVREMWPRPLWHQIPEFMRHALEGPNPRTVGDWREESGLANGHTKRWYSESAVSLTQWKVYQETGCYNKRLWIIQGERGGHLLRFSTPLRNFLRSHGRPEHPPAPGDLPYADYGPKTFDALARLDRLQRFEGDWQDRTERTRAGLIVQRERWQEEQDYAKVMLDWLDAQVVDAVRDLPRSALPSFSDLPAGDGYYNRDQDELEERLIKNTASAPLGA